MTQKVTQSSIFGKLNKKEVVFLFWDNFVNQCEKIEKSPTVVVEDLGFKRSAVTSWKNGALPQVKNRKKIADYFGISVEELMGTKKEPAGQGELEREWADIEVAYKSATPEARAAAKAAALAVLESSKKEG
nr:MAG TPA: nucleoid-associated protein [Caudoviricetes sp.]